MKRRENTVAPLLEPDVIAPNRLFVVRNRHTGVLAGVADVHYFANKQDAKSRRDMLNEGEKKTPWHVALGPDHWRYKS